MKKLSIILLICIGVVVLVGLKPADTYLGRYIFWNKPDVYDLEKFMEKPIRASKIPNRIYNGKKVETLNDVGFNFQGIKTNLSDLNKKTKTRAFLILKNDSLVFESYFMGASQHTNFKSFSMAKSILSVLVGIAIDEAKIKSVHQQIGEFNLGIIDEKVNNLTIENLLLQNTQLQYDDSYAPWADEPRWYYSLDVRSLTKGVKIDLRKAKRYENVEYNNFLLAMILEKTTQKSISNYLEEKLWIPAGMLHDSFFSIDSEANQFEKVADGFNAKAIDFLSFGRLMLKKGKIGNKQIVTEEWISKSTSHKNSIKSDKQEVNYKYLWWTKPNGDFYANGHHGQYIYVSPNSNTVIVRLGEESGNIAWYRDVFPLLNNYLK